MSFGALYETHETLHQNLFFHQQKTKISKWTRLLDKHPSCSQDGAIDLCHFYKIPTSNFRSKNYLFVNPPRTVIGLNNGLILILGDFSHHLWRYLTILTVIYNTGIQIFYELAGKVKLRFIHKFEDFTTDGTHSWKFVGRHISREDRQYR